MSKLVGVLRGKKIYDNDPRLVQLQGEVEYIAVRNDTTARFALSRCDYCGCYSNNVRKCDSCGAPL